MIFAFRCFIVVLVFLAAPSAFATSWKYTAFPLVKYEASDRHPAQIKVGKTLLHAAFPSGSPTIGFLGVEQLYSNDGLKKRLFVKKNVKLSSQVPIGGWEKVANGMVLHLRDRDRIIAYYAEGFDNREMNELRIQLSKSVRSTVYYLPSLIPCANAEVTGPGKTPTTRQGEVEPRDKKSNDSLAWCITKKTWSALGEAAVGAWDATKKGAQDIYNDPWGATKGVGSWLWDTGGAIGTGVKNGVVATKDYAVATWQDPNKIYKDVSGALDKTQQIAQTLYNQVKTSFKEFKDLPPDVQNTIVCEIAGDIAAEGLIGVVLTAAGGAGLVKLAAVVAKYAIKLKDYSGVLQAIARAKNMSAEKVSAYVRKILRGKDDPSKLLAEIEPERVLAKGSMFKPGQEVQVPRSDGSRNPGKVTDVNPDGSVRVEFTDPKTGSPAFKVVSKDQLEAVNSPPTFQVGQSLKVPRSNGTTNDGKVVELLPDGRVRVEFVDPANGQLSTKVLLRDSLRTANSAESSKPEPQKVGSPQLYSFRSVKGEDYKARGGDIIAVDYNSENLRKTMKEALDVYSANKVKPVDPGARPNPEQLERASKAWLQYAAKIESKETDEDAYDRARNEIIDKGKGRGDLGEIAVCEAAVCRELSIFGSLSLAELGYTTRVVTGDVTGGAHAWIEFLDPKTNKVIGVLDSNYTKRFYSDPQEYYRDENARPIRYTTVATPRGR